MDVLGVDQSAAICRIGRPSSQPCRGVDVVYHVAAKAGLWGPREGFYAANVTAPSHHRRVSRHGVRKLVYTSSLA